MDLAALDQAMKFLQFKFSTLEKATDCFNEANKLGSGGYGEVFKVYAMIFASVLRKENRFLS